MFSKIFWFEIQNRIRRPAVYLYFFTVLALTLLSFATGSLPVGEKEHINSPYLISFWCAAMSMMMMLVSSSVMGTALFRDIEYQTKDYYLTYPITKNGYFWGRFLGSFTFMLLIALAIPIGIYLSSFVGPLTGKTLAAQFGPNRAIYYWYPFLMLALPNIFFSSAVFFGLVAVVRNVKVIYFGGLLLFMFYTLSVYFLNHTTNLTVIQLADPFGLNGVRFQMSNSSTDQHNQTLILMNGAFGLNRILWTGISLIVLAITYLQFNFESFFAGKRDRSAIGEAANRIHHILIHPAVSFSGTYNRSTLKSLIGLELSNILRDNYFSIILGAGSVWLGFILWLGDNHHGIADYPRTVVYLGLFAETFPFLLFFILMFYTGETLQRDRISRYALINDSLPPPNWVINASKLITLLIIAVGLSFVPFVLGVSVQLIKGYTTLNLPAYLSFIFVMLMPKLLAATVFCYLTQVIFNNKFAAFAFGITLWVGMYFLDSTSTFNYHLLLYSYTPKSGINDMDSLGHMLKPLVWFNVYWLLGAGLMIVLTGLFFSRGVGASFKERLQLVPERFNRGSKLALIVVLPLFLVTGMYIYYNISYLNEYLTKQEGIDRAVLYEKTLKRYNDLPLPKVTRMILKTDLYPKEKKAFTDAVVTIINKNRQPISQMLLDADMLTSYSMSLNGKPIRYTCPLLYKHGLFSWFRPEMDTAAFRLYTFDKPLAPGDSATLHIRSAIVFNGFQNGFYAGSMLNNGTFSKGGLPNLGYDEDDELSSPYERKQAGLPPKVETEMAQNDPKGLLNLKSGAPIDLFAVDITVSTDGDQLAVANGELVKQWKSGDRNYFHYIQNNPKMYMPFGIFSARYAVRRDSVMLDRPVAIEIYYNPAQGNNLDRYLQGYKDGLRYMSKTYGNYPFKQIRLVQCSPYGSAEGSSATLDFYSELNGWNADFTDPNQSDYLYNSTVFNTAQQWWRFQVAPNSTVGSLVIPEGIANYDALVINEQKYGRGNLRNTIISPLGYYLFARRHMDELERPIIKANQSVEWGFKTGTVLYGLRELIGQQLIDQALLEFKNTYAFKSSGPFAGAPDLYRVLQKHTPDSLQYYLNDTWQKITLYDNKVLANHIKRTGRHNEYEISFKVRMAKTWLGSNGQEIPALNMNDYFDVGVYGDDAKAKDGRIIGHIIKQQRFRLTAGDHELKMIVNGKPKAVVLDPLAYQLDRNPNDNWQDIQQ
ncbi:hypothetical protein [Mucilaginibacter sp. UR6-11]|uniref:ABC transporter permease/M1 family aminopeptidase n=1 Tax=Mucilaginibacter sp. UR6-11 TaxID=1435644 RepID=UPI001E418C61|nr:hypothetical protein [Mucilaginibacter sp. UR6-11]MCC8425801.1 hypothetical protein [Mucilaginibacter sp. UR6-11]